MLFLILPAGFGVPLIIATALVTLAAVWFKQVQAVHLAFFTFLWILASVRLPSLSWPFHLMVPLAVYAGFVGTIPRLRATVSWLCLGRYGPDIGWLVIATVLLSGVGLLLWYFGTRPGLAPFFELLPELPLALVPLAGLCFATLNGIMEESVFRGVMMQALESALGVGPAAVVIQAALFGALHYGPGAFPNGLWGGRADLHLWFYAGMDTSALAGHPGAGGCPYPG